MYADPGASVDYTSLLNYYKAADIDLIIEDLTSIQNGYQFLYIIDTYDIVENYLPYTEIEIFSKNVINSQAQKFICYDYFFGGYNKTNSILLDEYKVELLAAKNKLNKQLREAKSVLKNLEDLKSQTDNFGTDWKKTEDFFRKNFEIILLLLILDNKKNSILEEFFLFIKERLNIDEFKSLSQKDATILDEIFLQSKQLIKTSEIFHTYIQTAKPLLRKVDNQQKRHIFLENTYRDIRVIERTIEINRKIKEKEMPYKIMYLSSAHKTGEILKICANIYPITDLSIHRNIYHYFLFDKLKNEYKDDIPAALKILQDLKILASKHFEKKEAINYPEVEDENLNSMMDILKVLFEETSNIIDNHFYLSIYDQYRNAFDKEGKASKVGNINQDVLRIIQRIDEKKLKFNTQLFNLDFSLSHLNQTYEILDIYKGFENYDPIYRQGKDIIRDPFHHLPNLLLAFDPSFPTPLRDLLFEFLYESCATVQPDKDNLKRLLKDIINEISRLNQQKIEDKLLKHLLITYINFVAPTNDKKTTNSISEELILDDVKRQNEIAQYQFSKFEPQDFNQIKQLIHIYDENIFVRETGYLLLWLYRRNEKCDTAIKLGIELFSRYNTDPRISHGLGLAYVALLYKKIKAKEPNEILEELIHHGIFYLSTALEIFNNLTIQVAEPVQKVIIKDTIAIHNLLADLHLRLLDLNKDLNINHINIARRNIDEIKKLYFTTTLHYKESPTYNMTECELEYFEACYFSKIGDHLKALDKLKNAFVRLIEIKKSQSSQQFIDEFFNKCEKELYELTRQIIKVK